MVLHTCWRKPPPTLGHTADGLQALAEAHTLVEQHEERWWEAEIYRLRGVLLLRQPGTPQAEAEAWLPAARPGRRSPPGGEIAGAACRHEPQSPLAAAGQAGRSAGAAGGIYGWFTEGFDTADLPEARVLLQELT